MNNARTFSVDSRQYARYRPSYPQELFAYLAEISPGRRAVWDCATGSGQAAVSCAGRFACVDATDISLEQLRYALPGRGVHYSVCSAEAAPFADQSFDLITVAQALHWFDQGKFFKEAGRLLKPGGILAIFGYAFFEISPDLDAVIQEVLLAPIDRYWAPGNRQLWSGYRDVPLPFSELVIPHEFNMRVEWTLAQLVEYLRTWSAVKLHAAEQGVDPLIRLETALKPLWGEPAEVRAVKMPLFLRVSRNAPP